MKKKLVRLTTIHGEELLCVLVSKDKISHTFETPYGSFTILNDDIQFVEIIGDINDNNS